MADLQLVVGGQVHEGWNRIRVHLGLEEASGTFDLGVSERWSREVAPIEVRPQDACAVKIAGETLITGFVDAVDNGYDARSHQVSVRGRDAAADLVDCSAQHAKGEWRNVDVAQIARDVAAPYGVKVSVAGDVGAPFPAFAIEPGETVYACIERAARQRGVRILSDGKGGLVIGAKPATASGASLIEGENLLSASAANDASERYSKYVVKGQCAGNDETNGAAAAQIKATAEDKGVKRARTLIIIDEDQGDAAGFTRRAKWEASTRGARGLTVNCRVQGWTHAGGLWRVNTTVPFRSPTLRLDRELLVRDVDFVVDEGGTFTDLVLTIPEAYSLLPMPEPRKAPARKGHKKAASTEDAYS